MWADRGRGNDATGVSPASTECEICLYGFGSREDERGGTAGVTARARDARSSSLSPRCYSQAMKDAIDAQHNTLTS